MLKLYYLKNYKNFLFIGFLSLYLLLRNNPMKILFVCQANRNRSRTAHEHFEKQDNLEVKSCGIIDAYVEDTKKNYWSRATKFSIDLYNWADKVIVLDSFAISKIHIEAIRNKLNTDKIIGIHINDIYEPNHPELILDIKTQIDPLIEKWLKI